MPGSWNIHGCIAGWSQRIKKSSKCEAYHYNKYKNGSGSALICNIKRSINLQRTEKKPKIACCKRERMGHCWLIKTSFSAAYELGQYVEFNSCTVTLSLPLLPSLVFLHPIADKAPWLTGLQNRKTSEFLFFFFSNRNKGSWAIVWNHCRFAGTAFSSLSHTSRKEQLWRWQTKQVRKQALLQQMQTRDM